MRPDTVRALEAVNRRFYHERAAEFSATRERPWPGWKAMFDRFQSLLPARPRVLDAGCGNARFARFLDERLGGAFDYLGVDSSPLALEEARRRLGSRPSTVLVEHDLLASDAPLAGKEFDLALLFGVLHHVPGRERRIELLRRVSESLAPSGLLAFSVWRLDRHERFRRKIVPWREEPTVDASDLEPGDYLLTWGSEGRALRYCHAMSEREEEEILEALPLSLLGKLQGTEPNDYFVLQKMGTGTNSRQPKSA